MARGAAEQGAVIVGPPATNRRRGVQWRPSGHEAIERETPQETPIGLSFNGRPHTVLMATPDDIEDLSVGFTITEGVAGFADISGVTLKQVETGVLADVQLRPGSAARKAPRPRTLEGRSSCGLCGVQRLSDAVRPLPMVSSPTMFRHEAVQRATDALGERQTLGRLTRATHAAAFAAADGTLLLVREDVGRHNALDKLGGAMARQGLLPHGGFVVVTSRCSFEMVEKTVRIGAPMLVAVSAPTDLAIEKATESGLTLVALARADGHTVFTHGERLIVPAREPA